ncbi:hypothetical protein D3C80_793000 [compost metagenome]
MIEQFAGVALDHAHGQSGMAVADLPQNERDHCGLERANRPDDDAARQGGRMACARLFDRIQRGANALGQIAGQRGRAHGAARAVEQGLADILLQPFHLQADGAGGQAHVVRGAGETAVPQDGVQGHQELELQGSLPCRAGAVSA